MKDTDMIAYYNYSLKLIASSWIARIVTILFIFTLFVHLRYEALPRLSEPLYTLNEEADPPDTALLSTPSDNSIEPSEPPDFPKKNRVPCYGVRGKLLTESPDDEVEAVTLDKTYPEPLSGSYKETGIQQTWSTFEGRYGPYGYGEGNETYDRGRVHWGEVDWAHLQSQCLEKNAKRSPHAPAVDNEPRFRFRQAGEKITTKSDTVSTGRTAIILRGWSTYVYRDEDMYNIRSMIQEAALASSGDYAVFLMVDIHDLGEPLFASHNFMARYQEVLDLLPKELRNIAILFDESLLENWYPGVEHPIPTQVYQATQLFSHFYPEFDYVWQHEMDVRYTGHVGRFLDSIANWAHREPRKQALERATYRYLPQIHGTYSDFRKAVNIAAHGNSFVWGPLKIPEVTHPIGPKPPSTDALSDLFKWGVREPADVITTGPCMDLRQAEEGIFGMHFLQGFSQLEQSPRFVCPPAMARASRTLLLAIHAAQTNQRLVLPSEATLPSFALYHGLKIAYPPLPWWLIPSQSPAEVDLFYNGGPPGLANASLVSERHASEEGDRGRVLAMAFGRGVYTDAYTREEMPKTSTWNWSTGVPEAIWRAWTGGELVGDGLGVLLRVVDGKVYAPNMAIHPVK